MHGGVHFGGRLAAPGAKTTGAPAGSWRPLPLDDFQVGTERQEGKGATAIPAGLP